MSEEYKTDLEKFLDTQDRAYQRGRAYERKRILEILKKESGPERHSLDMFVEDIEELIKEPHKD